MVSIEKCSKTMRRAGGFGVAMGIVTLVTGVTVGVLSILNGASLISKS